MIMSQSSIKICSLNIKGCKNPVKRNRLLSFFKKENASVATLQETHLTDEEHIKLKKDWVEKSVFFSLNSKSRGVAIIIHKKVPLIVDHFEADSNGCYVFTHGFLYGEKKILFLMYTLLLIFIHPFLVT